MPNAYDVRGRALAAVPRWDKPVRIGCGQHGGLARYEQSPMLMIEGPGFAGGTTRAAAAHIVNLAPTILRHLRLPETGMDGHALQIPAATCGRVGGRVKQGARCTHPSPLPQEEGALK
jgi:hypothetical protein